MTVDMTLTFAARRNVPVRYDRNLVATTIKAMDRVAEIRAKRERRFYKERMRGNREKEMLANAKVVAEGEHLLPRMKGSERLAVEALEMGEAEKVAEEEEVVEETVEEARVKRKMKAKRRLLVGGGTEDVMDVD